MKTLFTILISFAAFLIIVQSRSNQENDLSGIKLAFNLNDLNLLKSVNYTQFYFNKTFLSEGMNMGNGGILGYSVSLGNITVGEFNPPQNAEIESRDIESNTPSVKINLKNLSINLFADYSVQFSIYKDSGSKKSVQVNVNQLSIDLTYNRVSQSIKVNHILLDINSLEIDFTGKVLQTLYWILKKSAISMITSNVDGLAGSLEQLINETSNKKILYNIDGKKIIGLNMTITDKPDLIFHTDKASSKITPVKFLADSKTTSI